ncbi:MAG: hypothetical protein ACTTKL_09760 [Treponema sp.]
MRVLSKAAIFHHAYTFSRARLIYGGFMKKSALLLCALAFFVSSCNFWNEPVKSWFEEYTQLPAVISSSYEGSFIESPDGAVNAASSKDFIVTLMLSNPHNFSFTAENMTLSFPDSLQSKGIDTSSVKIAQDADDPSKIRITYPKEFLRKTECGVDISPKVNLRHPKVGMDLGTYDALRLVSNSPPPLPAGAVLYKDTSQTPARYVVCFNMPAAGVIKTGTVHHDLKTLKIGGEIFPIELNDDGTFCFSDSRLLQGELASHSAFVKLKPTAPEFKKTGQPVYFKTSDAENTGEYDYPIELIDKAGLSSKTFISTRSVQLKPPSARANGNALSSGTHILDADNGGEFANVTLTPPAQTVSGTAVDGAEVVYELWRGHAAGGTLIASGALTSSSVSVKIPGGDTLLRAYAHKNGFVDSASADYKLTVKAQVFFVKGSGATVLTGEAADTNEGTRQFPLLTAHKAFEKVSAVTSGTPVLHTVFIDGETAEAQLINAGSAGQMKHIIVEKLNGAEKAVIARAEGGALSHLIRVAESSALTLGGITVDGKNVSHSGSGIYTEGTLAVNGCVIQNFVTTAGKGSAIHVEKGRCALNGAVVKDCASSGGIKSVYLKADSSPDASPVLTVSGGTKVGSDTDATSVCAGEPAGTNYAHITAQDLTSGAHINITAEDFAKQYNTRLVKAAGAAPSAYMPYFRLTGAPSDARYRLESGESLHGFGDAILLRKTAVISAKSDGNEWAHLKYAVEHAIDGDEVIVKGAIKAKSSGNIMINGVSVSTSGHIRVVSNVTVKGEENAVLDADGQSRIFTFDTSSGGEPVERTLTLKNLTLKNGKVSSGGSHGGLIVVKEKKKLILDSCTAEGCSAESGGAVYAEAGGECVLKDSTLKDNSAKDGGTPPNLKGGAVFVAGANGSVPAGKLMLSGSTSLTAALDTAAEKKNDVYLADGAVITVKEALSAARVARITLQTYAENKVVARGDGSVLTADSADKFTLTQDNASKEWKLTYSDGTLKLRK